MGVVKGAIGLKDNATAVLQGIRKEQSAFRKDVEATRKELTRTWDKKYKARVDATAAAKGIKKLTTAAAPLRKKIVTAVAIKDMATAKIKSVSNKLKAVGKMAISPVVKLKKGLTAGISKAKGQLKSLTKAVAIPVAIAATVASVVLGGAVKGGMELEQQQVSMEHFITATNKGMPESEVKKMSSQFSAELRANANKTPFETGEVMAAGSRAVAIASGNTKEAMSLVRLSEDMAAASGGTKTISDAMEALADAKMGEMERLKEFGFKVSAEEFDAKGFAGVSGELNDFFGGAAEKLASTGAGLMSTIKGKLKSNFADFGLKVVDKLKPAFEGVISLIEKSEPFLTEFGTKIADGVGNGIQAVTSFLPTLMSGINAVKPVFVSLAQAVIPVISSIMTTIKTVMTTVTSVISSAAPIISGMVQGIGTVISTLAPVFNTIFGAIGEKVGSVISFVSERMGFIQEVISTVAPVVSDILTVAWSVISPVLDIVIGAFKMLFSVVQKVFPGVQKVITSVWNFIKPLVEGIGKVMSAIASGWNWLVDKVTGSGDDVGTNARGTSNWKGGLTWVGEEGPELVNLPRGSQVMPNKESMAYSKSQRNAGNLEVPATSKSPQTGGIVSQIKRSISVTVAKLADTIVVREDADIDKIGAAVADKIVKVVLNMP